MSYCTARLRRSDLVVIAACTRLADHDGPHRDGPREWETPYTHRLVLELPDQPEPARVVLAIPDETTDGWEGVPVYTARGEYIGSIEGPAGHLVTEESAPEPLNEPHACDSMQPDSRHGGTTAPTGETPDALAELAASIEAHLSQPPGRDLPPAVLSSTLILELLHRVLAAETAITDLAVAGYQLADRIDSIEDHLALSATDVVQRILAAQAVQEPVTS